MGTYSMKLMITTRDTDEFNRERQRETEKEERRKDACSTDVLPVITSATETRFLVWFVCLSVCKKDYAKTNQPIFMKLGVEVEHGPRKDPLHVGADPFHFL